MTLYRQVPPQSGVACRRCGCTELQACAGGCYWAAPDLCSKCMTVGDHGCALDQDEGHFDWICPGCDFTGTNLKYAYPRCPVCGEGMERLDEDDLIDPQDYPL